MTGRQSEESDLHIDKAALELRLKELIAAELDAFQARIGVGVTHVSVQIITIEGFAGPPIHLVYAVRTRIPQI